MIPHKPRTSCAACGYVMHNEKGEADMNKNLRKAVIAGNWKMNNTRVETKALIEAAHSGW